MTTEPVFIKLIHMYDNNLREEFPETYEREKKVLRMIQENFPRYYIDAAQYLIREPIYASQRSNYGLIGD